MLDSWSDWGDLAAVVVPIGISVAALSVSVRTSLRENRRWREEHRASLRLAREARYSDLDGYAGEGLAFVVRNVGKAPALDLQGWFEFPGGERVGPLYAHPLTLMPDEERRLEGRWLAAVDGKLPNEDEHGYLWGKAVLTYVDEGHHRLEANYRLSKQLPGVMYSRSIVERGQVTLDGGQHPQSLSNDRQSRRRRTKLKQDPPEGF